MNSISLKEKKMSEQNNNDLFRTTVLNGASGALSGVLDSLVEITNPNPTSIYSHFKDARIIPAKRLTQALDIAQQFIFETGESGGEINGRTLFEFTFGVAAGAALAPAIAASIPLIAGTGVGITIGAGALITGHVLASYVGELLGSTAYDFAEKNLGEGFDQVFFDQLAEFGERLGNAIKNALDELGDAIRSIEDMLQDLADALGDFFAQDEFAFELFGENVPTPSLPDLLDGDALEEAFQYYMDNLGDVLPSFLDTLEEIFPPIPSDPLIIKSFYA